MSLGGSYLEEFKSAKPQVYDKLYYHAELITRLFHTEELKPFAENLYIRPVDFYLITSYNSINYTNKQLSIEEKIHRALVDGCEKLCCENGINTNLFFTLLNKEYKELKRQNRLDNVSRHLGCLVFLFFIPVTYLLFTAIKVIC